MRQLSRVNINRKICWNFFSIWASISSKKESCIAVGCLLKETLSDTENAAVTVRWILQVCDCYPARHRHRCTLLPVAFQADAFDPEPHCHCSSPLHMCLFAHEAHSCINERMCVCAHVCFLFARMQVKYEDSCFIDLMHLCLFIFIHALLGVIICTYVLKISLVA